MPQKSFSDLLDCPASLDVEKDPLVEFNSLDPWEELRPVLECVWRKTEGDRKSRAGRKAVDASDVAHAGPERVLQPFSRPDSVSIPRLAFLQPVSWAGA